MHMWTQRKYHCIRYRVRSVFINRFTLIFAVALCLTAPPAFAQGVAGPFSGSAVDSKTMRIQERVEELFEQGDYERALIIYRQDLAPIGDKYAQYMVGYMYLTGTGVDEDPVMASAWYRLAAERSYKEFLNERDQLLGAFSDVDLLHSDILYLQLRHEYSDVVLLLNLIKDDIESMPPTTGSRLSGGSSAVTMVDTHTGSTVSRDSVVGQLNRRIEARLKFMSKQLKMPNLDTDPDDLDLDELETVVISFVDTITDR
jgi:hypothetical protein